MKLIRNVYGTDANGDSKIFENRIDHHPTTIYVSATDFDTASVQAYISPAKKANTEDTNDVWFPLGTPFTTNGFFTFHERYGKLKFITTGASANTAGLNGWID